MCGINAIIDLDNLIPDKRERVSMMNSLMVYRGPDGEGIHADPRVALGIRRLSIIDVAGGAQPIYNEDRSMVIVCNGEIYNYVELMDTLKQRGHKFSSHSDVETILHLYEDKEEACLQDLRGMFAFVIWDIERGRVFAARDRIGIKPLYLSRQGGALLLSSEIRTILAAAECSPTLRPGPILEFLAYSYPLDQRHTPLLEVDRFLPGEYLLADASGLTLKRYWEPRFGGKEGIADRDDGQILDTLQDAIRIHLRSDVPVGILLSGGLDSSTLAAMASREGSNFTAICVGYTGSHAVDERAEARATARQFGLSFIEIENDVANFESHFEELVRYCDEPVGDIAAMAQWGLYQQARSLGFKVLLSGIGGDEIFFGYPVWNELGVVLDNMDGDTRSRIQFLAARLFKNLGGEIRQVAVGALGEASKELQTPLMGICKMAPKGPDEVAAMLFGSYLVHNGCQLADKLGMGCSVEVRVPLLDHIFVERVCHLPLARRFEAGRNKPLLRRLMRGILRDSLLDAPKRGFTPPGGFIGSLAYKQADILLDGQLVRHGWVDAKQLEKIIQKGRAMPWLKTLGLRHALGITQSPWFLFRLLAFERWYENLASPAIVHDPLS